MLTRLFFFLILIFSSWSYAQSNLPLAEKLGTKIHYLLFNRLDVVGRANVSLHTGYKRPHIIVHGHPLDLNQTYIRLRGETVEVRIGKGHPKFGPVSVDVRAGFLNAVTFKGAGAITGSSLHSGLLDLVIDNPGQTTLGGTIFVRKLKASGGGNIQISGVQSPYLQLSIQGQTRVNMAGMMNLSKLDLEGKGSLSMYWLKSKDLTVCGKGHTYIQLAGIVNRLEVELWDSARFNGRYLRANRAFVRTRGRSVADITVLEHQSTLATDASDIYFYNIPDTKADFMAYAGSVLDMRDWNPPDLPDYTRFNK